MTPCCRNGSQGALIGKEACRCRCRCRQLATWGLRLLCGPQLAPFAAVLSVAYTLEWTHQAHSIRHPWVLACRRRTSC